MDANVNSEFLSSAGMEMRVGSSFDGRLKNRYRVDCYDKDGKLRWTDYIDNLVTTAGKNDIINKYFSGSAYTASYFAGLVQGPSASATFAAADVMSSHSGWTEATGYSNAGRPSLAFGAAAGGSASNSPAAAFSINANATISGAFLVGNAAAASTIGSTAGTLYGEGLFATGDRSVLNGDTLNFTATVSVS